MTRDRLVAVASEAGAVPFTAAETVRRGRLGPGELLLVEPGRRAILEDAEAKARALRALPIHDAPRPVHEDRRRAPRRRRDRTARPTTDHVLRYLAGLDAERARLDIKTMALEGHEPLWSMGDDTPTPGRGRLDRPVADHLRQAFAQVTNPAIDPERERIVMDLRVELGRRPALLGGPPRGPRTAPAGAADRRRPRRPARRAFAGGRPAPARSTRRGPPTTGPPAWTARWIGSAAEAVAASAAGAEVLVLTDARLVDRRLPIPSILATGAVHTALTEPACAGGRTSSVERRRHPRRPCDGDGPRGRRDRGPSAARDRARRRAGRHARRRGAQRRRARRAGWSTAFEAGLRKTLARMGISAVASYIGGALIDVIDLDAAVVARCFPTAAAWPGRTTFADLAERQLRRRAAALAIAEPAAGREPRLPDPGFARFRADGEAHMFSPRIAGEIRSCRGSRRRRAATSLDAALARYRAALARPRRPLRPARRAARPPRRVAGRSARSRTPAAIVRRFVVSAMSVGALSPRRTRR